VLAALAAAALLLVPLIALASDTFGDVPGTLPQHDAINRVYAAGIMRACTAGTPPNFCPNDPVLRAQQASQWDRALGLNGTPNASVYVGRSRATDISSAYRLPGPAAISTLDSGPYIGRYAAVAIGVDGLPWISYHTSPGLRMAHCATTSCTTATLVPVNSNAEPTSIGVGADGLRADQLLRPGGARPMGEPLRSERVRRGRGAGQRG